MIRDPGKSAAAIIAAKMVLDGKGLPWVGRRVGFFYRGRMYTMSSRRKDGRLIVGCAPAEGTAKAATIRAALKAFKRQLARVPA